jgi:hypothetical protein
VAAKLEALHVASNARARVRLTIDGQGRVARVEVLSASDASLRRELESRLARLELGAARAGTVEVILTAQPRST